MSVGLFGDWGSGKSFFMRRLQERIAKLADAARVRTGGCYCGHIVQIRFNAWHYAEANLYVKLRK